MSEPSVAMSAHEWREFWRDRGMRELRLVLWASWSPLGGAPPGEHDDHVFRIASLLGSRASREVLADELGRIRRERLGDGADRARDEYAAGKIGDWFDHVGTRDR